MYRFESGAGGLLKELRGCGIARFFFFFLDLGIF